MNGMLITEVAHIAEQEHMRAAMMHRSVGIERRLRRRHALRNMVRGWFGASRQTKAPAAAPTNTPATTTPGAGSAGLAKAQ